MAAEMNSGSDSRSEASGWGRRGFIGAVAATAAAAAVATPASASASALSPERPPRRTRQLFLGTYTSQSGGGTGLGLATYDDATGRITGTGTLAGVPDPSYLCLHPSGRTLYAVNERERGGVTAIALSASGPEVLGSRGTGGAGPCHLSVHPSGRWLLSANYLSGSVAVHPIQGSGALGELTDSVTHSSPPPGPGQDGPHAHQIVTSPDGGHLLAVDLGNDAVYSYRLDTKKGKLTQVSYATLRPGAGPRHLTFHPSGRFAYLANEVDNTVVVCGYDPASGRLTPGAPQSTGTGEGTSYPAQLLVTREGAFAFLANRGHNSLTRYAIEEGGARLRLLDTVPVGGDFPRHIAFSPSQRLLFAANQKSSSVSVFQVGKDGQLRLTGAPFAAPLAVCALPV
ncbi:lactonase family protein [Streptomyces durmitorensis]|uniref:Lactonase family protein n=1 Tax=Streptomyces durmitorensis TaxID=319947 RepID=A0ABY4Q527_9ACTN|nr:lactonase family protein [Streptomyces durmitorensis]UQT60490.1 lactonase family protein [Streptomyces durmitorensis]